MKNHNKASEKSSTKLASLNNAVSHIKNEINPIPRATRCSATPKPMRSTAQVWIKRKIRIIKQSASSITITNSDIYGALTTFQVTGDSAFVRVDGLKAWNVTNSSSNSNYLSVTPDLNIFNSSSSGTNSLIVPYEDFGGGAISPSVSVNFPMTLTKSLTVIQGSSTTFCTVGVVPTGLAAVTAQTVVVDVYLAVGY